MSDDSARAPKRVEIEFDTAAPALEAPASFLRECGEFGLEFDEGDLERLGRFLALLLEANKSFNLTAITKPEQAWRRHIFDSLTLLPLLEEVREAMGAAGGAEIRVADVGSGGGLPGVPLAIVLPSMRFTLIEATGKKAKFLEAAAAALGLANVEVVNRRAEEVAQDHQAHRGRYDAVTARAVGPLAVVAELTVPLAKVGGRVLIIKGEKAEEEMASGAGALRLLGAEHVGTVPTPTGRIVVLEKTRPTVRAYPRRAGEPKRKPLG